MTSNNGIVVDVLPGAEVKASAQDPAGEEGRSAIGARASPGPHGRLIDDYLLYLRERRGLCPETLELVRAPCHSLMDSVATEGIADLRSIPPAVVTRFITRAGEHYSRNSWDYPMLLTPLFF
jgi:hypothetical protein